MNTLFKFLTLLLLYFFTGTASYSDEALSETTTKDDTIKIHKNHANPDCCCKTYPS